MSQALDDLESSVDAQALKASSTTADGVSVSRRSLTELDAHVARRRADAAAQSPAAFLQGMTVKLVPPGAS